LTPTEIRAIEDMVTSPDYRHVPTGTLAVLARLPRMRLFGAARWIALTRR
jgi:hypothetical protein